MTFLRWQRSGRSCVVLAVAVLATACGGPQAPGTRDAPATIRKVSISTAAVSTQATADLPRVVNPAEELSGFDPRGILRWTEVPGADAYEVWVHSDWQRTELVEFSGALASRQYQFRKLAGGTSFWLTIYCRVAGEWREAPQVYVVTATEVVKARLANPQEEIEAFAAGGTLRWSPVEGADSYEVWIYQDRGLQALAETSGPLRVNQYPLRALEPGRKYYAQVYSRVAGVFHVGGPLELTVVAESARARIVNPQEELDAFAPDGLLRWTSAPGATAYEVWIFTNPNASEIHESSGSLATRSYAARTLEPGSTYYVQVYALVNGEWQVGSPVKLTTTPQATIARLSNPQEELEAFATNGTLRWNAVPGADRYEVWIYVSAGLGTVAEVGFPAGRSHQATRLCGGGVYYVELYARVNGQWTTGWATRLSVTQGESPANCVPPVPMVTLTASPAEVHAGESVTLAWQSRFADSCKAGGDWSGARPAGGSQTLGPLTNVSRFSLQCDGPSGSTYSQVLVVIALPKYAAVSVMEMAWALNGLGDVSGAYRFHFGPGVYLWNAQARIDGRCITFLPQSSWPSAGLDINSRRQVTIGSYYPRTYCCWGYLYSDGAVTRLEGLSPLGINEQGHVVGAAGPPSRAALLVDGLTTTLPTPAGADSIAYDLNDRDEIVGEWWNPDDPQRPQRMHAFLYAGGRLTELGTLGGDSSHPEAINASGTIVGNARMTDGREHAFRYDASGMEDLGTLGGATSGAMGIDDEGRIVGYAEAAFPRTTFSPYSAFLYAHGMMYDLNDYLVVPPAYGVQLTSAVDINAHGQILANACGNYGAPPFYGCTAYLLTPVGDATGR